MPSYQECLSQITATLQPLVKEGQPVGEDSELLADLGLTSLQVMELIEHVEDHYDISIPLNILPEVRTVRDLGKQLEKILGPRE